MIRNEWTRLYKYPKFKLLVVFLMGMLILNIGTSFPDKRHDALYNTLPTQKEDILNEPYFSELMNTDGGFEIVSQAEYIVNRKETITKEIDNLESMLKSGLLDSDKELKQVEQKISFYKSQLDLDLSIENIKLSETRLNSLIPTIGLLIIAVFLAILIFYDDYEAGFNSLYKTSKMGLSRLFCNKLMLYLILLLVSTMAFYTIDLIILSKSNYLVQSIPSYTNVYKPMTVLHFVSLSYIKILFLSVLVSTLVTCMLYTIKRQSIVGLIVALIALFEWLLSIFISSQSKVAFIKNFNIYTILFKYKFEYPSRFMKFFSVLTILATLLLILLYLFYVGKLKFNKQININLSLKSTNILLNSMYQVFISSGGIFVFILILLFSLYNMNSFKISNKPGEKSYVEFKQQYLGKIDDNLIERLNEFEVIMHETVVEKNRLLKEVELNPDKANEIYSENYEIFEISKNEDNLQMLREEINLSLEYGVNHVVDNRGANLLFMVNQTRFIILNLTVLWGSLILIGFHQTKLKIDQNNMPFIKTSKVGIKRFNQIEDISLLMLSTLATGLLMLLHYRKIKGRLPINWMNSLRDLLILDSSISVIVMYLIVLCVISIIGFLFIKLGSLYYAYTTSLRNKN